MGSGPLISTWEWAPSSRHGLRPAQLDIGLGPLELTLVLALSSGYRTWKTQLDMGLDWLDWTLAWANSAHYWPWPTRVDSISARAWTTQHRPRPGQLNIDPGLDWLCRLDIEPERLSSTWAWTGSTGHWHGLTQLIIGLGRLGSTQIGTGLDDSTSTQARTTRQWPRPALLDIGRARMILNRPRPAHLDIDSGLLGSTSTQARSSWHLPGPARLDIGPSNLTSTLA